MAEALVLTDLSDGVFTLTLNRPEASNALSAATTSLLKLHLQEAAANPAYDEQTEGSDSHCHRRERPGARPLNVGSRQ